MRQRKGGLVWPIAVGFQFGNETISTHTCRLAFKAEGWEGDT